MADKNKHLWLVRIEGVDEIIQILAGPKHVKAFEKAVTYLSTEQSRKRYGLKEVPPRKIELEYSGTIDLF